MLRVPSSSHHKFTNPHLYQLYVFSAIWVKIMRFMLSLRLADSSFSLSVSGISLIVGFRSTKYHAIFVIIRTFDFNASLLVLHHYDKEMLVTPSMRLWRWEHYRHIWMATVSWLFERLNSCSMFCLKKLSPQMVTRFENQTRKCLQYSHRICYRTHVTCEW